jgi:hypothetical protein
MLGSMEEPLERRRWTTKLETAISPGHNGQPGHKAGASITIIDLVEVPDIGSVSISVPRPSMLLLGPAREHMVRAEGLRAKAVAQVVEGEWVQEGHEKNFEDEESVFDFFQEAMSGLVLAHTALDNLLNESLPFNFEFEVRRENWNRQRIESSAGIERKLTQFVPAATGRQNVATAEPALFARLMELKRLRDDVGHARLDRGYGRIESGKTIFSDLFAADLDAFIDDVRAVGVHYDIID